MSQTKARSHVDLLNGSPGKNLLLFALPMILGNLFQQFYNMADSMIVGNFVGEESLAAVGASYALTNVFIMIAIGGGNGASVITSQYLGAKNYNRMKTSISTALISFLVLSLLLGGFGFAYNGEILRRLQTPENVLDQARLYLGIYFLGMPFLFMYNVLAAIFNAMGDSRTPLYLLIFSSVLNVGLDILSVTVFGMGVDGVAIATVVAQGVSACISFFLLMRKLRGYRSERAEGERFAFFDPPHALVRDKGCGPVHFTAVHRVHRHAAGSVCGQQLRLRGIGRVLGGKPHRIPVHRAHDRHRKRGEHLHGSEYRRRQGGAGEAGLPGQLRHCDRLCGGHRGCCGNIPRADYFQLPERG